MATIIISLIATALLSWFIFDRVTTDFKIQLFVYENDLERIFIGDFKSWTEIDEAKDDYCRKNYDKMFDFETIPVVYTRVKQISGKEKAELIANLEKAEYVAYREQFKAWSENHKKSFNERIAAIRNCIALSKNLLNETQY